MAAELIKQIARDVGEIKERIKKIEITIEELDSDLHEVRPEYIEKLKGIEKRGKVHKYSNVAELRKAIEQ